MPHKREILYQPARELRVQTSPDGSRTITGYAIRYNEPSSDLGGFVEIVAPGAVTDSLKTSPDVLCLRDHDQTILLGRTKAKTLTLTDDSAGLRFVCNLPDTAQASDLATSIDRGDLDGVSFGFVTLKDKWASDGQGNVTRTLLQVKLLEISPCSFPAYPSTSVSVRSCPKDLRPLIRSRAKDDDVDALFADDWNNDPDDDDDDDCDCDCSECRSGNHQACTDPEGCDFDDDDDDEDEDTRSLDIWRLKTQIAIAQRR